VIVLPAILFLLAATGLSLRSAPSIGDALSREQTQVVKGIFVVSVFFSHFCSYVALDKWFDKPLQMYCTWLGQLMVVPFLFYSGYGVFESVREKGAAYVGTFPRKRILKTLLHFDMAVLLFVVFDVFFAPERLSASAILGSLVAWDSLGNSNWFVFAILCAYLFCWAGLVLSGGDRFRSLLATTFLCLCYMAVISRFKEHWWWDTILAFPLGCAVSLWKGKLACTEKTRSWLAYCVLAFAAQLASKRGWIPGLHGQTAMVSLTALIVLFSVRFALGSRILSWFGQQVFGIYILQRLPMEFGRHFHWNEGHVWPYFLFCLATTLALAVAFDKTTRFADSRLFGK
jgi:hypothetical protein